MRCSGCAAFPRRQEGFCSPLQFGAQLRGALGKGREHATSGAKLRGGAIDGRQLLQWASSGVRRRVFGNFNSRESSVNVKTKASVALAADVNPERDYSPFVRAGWVLVLALSPRIPYPENPAILCCFPQTSRNNRGV